MNMISRIIDSASVVRDAVSPLDDNVNLQEVLDRLGMTIIVDPEEVIGGTWVGTCLHASRYYDLRKPHDKFLVTMALGCFFFPDTGELLPGSLFAEHFLVPDDRLRAYIATHCQDGKINLTRAADHFGLTHGEMETCCMNRNIITPFYAF